MSKKPAEPKVDAKEVVKSVKKELRRGHTKLREINDEPSGMISLEYGKDENGNLDSVKGTELTVAELRKELTAALDKIGELKSEIVHGKAECSALEAQLHKSTTPKGRTENTPTRHQLVRMRERDRHGVNRTCANCGRRVSVKIIGNNEVCDECRCI